MKELENYLKFERAQYLFSHDAKKNSDCIINAELPLELQLEEVTIWLERSIRKVVLQILSLHCA